MRKNPTKNTFKWEIVQNGWKMVMAVCKLRGEKVHMQWLSSKTPTQINGTI